MQSKKTTAFTTTVTERDWEIELSGWRCPALKIPGAKVDAVFVSGNRADSSWYEVNYELNIIRWVRSKHPLQATILITLTEELSTKELTLRWKKLAIILHLVSSLAAALVTGIFSHIFNTRTQQTDNSNTAVLFSPCSEELKIVAPADNATVPRQVNIKGTYQNLPPSQKIYIMVYPTDIGKYYPQPNPINEQLGNTWSCDVSIGLDHSQDVGRIFFIYAVLANKDAQKELDIYINQVKDVNDSPGMNSLPKGAQICSSVRVKRK